MIAGSKLSARPSVCVHTVFEQQVARAPDRVALAYSNRVQPGMPGTPVFLTYAELDRWANRLARQLQTYDVAPDDRVGILLPRTPDLIAALLATLKAGGAYLPLDPSYPKPRTEFMLRDAAPKLVITQRDLVSRLPENAPPIICVDEGSTGVAGLDSAPVDSSVAPEHLAYVPYTSGSTGQPKGVEVPHRAITGLVQDANFVELSSDCVMLMTAPVTFDASIFEIWAPLLNGGRLVLHFERIPSARGLARSIEQFGVTTMFLTTALFHAIVDDDPRQLAGLRQLVVGGEVLGVSHAARALEQMPQTALINGYGPTETTTFATSYTVPRPLDPDQRSIPIGRALQHTELHVLNERRERVADGEVGELYIGGNGVSRGYLGRPDLTQQRFIEDPDRFAGRCYRTGDMVRKIADGVLEFHGRIDDQIKLHGYRIELGEIEVTLGKHPSVSQAAVRLCVDQSGHKRIVAYTVGALAQPPPEGDLRRFLAERLPAYMVPAQYLALSALPLTPSGKVDRQALPDPLSR